MARLPDGTKVRALDAAGARVADFFVLDPDIVPAVAAATLHHSRPQIGLVGGPTTSPWPPVANGPDQRVAVYAADGSRIGGFSAYPGLFQGGVRVALGDVDGDRRPETITAPGPGMEPEIGVFSQTWNDANDRGTRLAHFLAFEPSFRGGINIAAGDLDGDGATELVVGAGPGRPPEIRIFDWARAPAAVVPRVRADVRGRDQRRCRRPERRRACGDRGRDADGAGTIRAVRRRRRRRSGDRAVPVRRGGRRR